MTLKATLLFLHRLYLRSVHTHDKILHTAILIYQDWYKIVALGVQWMNITTQDWYKQNKKDFMNIAHMPIEDYTLAFTCNRCYNCSQKYSWELNLAVGPQITIAKIFGGSVRDRHKYICKYIVHYNTSIIMYLSLCDLHVSYEVVNELW